MSALPCSAAVMRGVQRISSPASSRAGSWSSSTATRSVLPSITKSVMTGLQQNEERGMVQQQNSLPGKWTAYSCLGMCVLTCHLD